MHSAPVGLQPGRGRSPAHRVCDSPNRSEIIGTSLDESKCRARPLAPLAAGIPPGAFGPWRVRPRARTAGATHPDPRTKPGTPAAEHRGFVGEVESCAHEAPGLGRKALSFARKAKSLARDPKSLAHGPKSLAAKAPGLAREVPEPDCRAKSPAREAPRLGREARRVGAEAEGLEAGARGLGREAWRPGEPDRRKAGDAARPPAPSPTGPTGRGWGEGIEKSMKTLDSIPLILTRV